jgi:hypothetical protein
MAVTVFLRLISVGALLGGFLLLATPAATADSRIRFQAPCNQLREPCREFDYDDPLPKSLRTFRFFVPSPGRVLYLFNGSMICGTRGPTTARRTVHIITQIGTDPDVVPEEGDPGAVVHQVIFPASSDIVRQSFNLSSTRGVRYMVSGEFPAFFKVRSLTRDVGTFCRFEQLSFSAVFSDG